jgi:hypothetical protein
MVNHGIQILCVKQALNVTNLQTLLCVFFCLKRLREKWKRKEND